ncbi:MAG: Trm112 family protein [Nanoarchaeota archaeon]
MNEIKKILCCPECRGCLIDNITFLFCKKCNIRYNIKDNIIVLISKELETQLRK